MKNDATNLRIVESSPASINDFNKVGSTFEVKSRLAPYMKEGQFGYTLEAVPGVYRKSYRNDEFDCTTYIGNPDKILYLACIDGEAVGQIALRRWWSRLAWIEEIRVESRYGRMRVGTKLMDAAIEWARKSGMPGIMIETQDTNAPACLLYRQYGFSLAVLTGYFIGARKTRVKQHYSGISSSSCFSATGRLGEESQNA